MIPSARARPYRGKRVFDIAILLIAAIPAFAIGVLCAVLIRVTSPGPVFFRQERIGMNGQPFRIWKFRTMIDADDNSLIPDESAITSPGKWLRRLSLDEIPQLMNVARGDMSIVGPRPALAHQSALHDTRQRSRLAVRPGITGLAQVNGRNAIPWADRIELDLTYVAHQSPALDLKILARTLAVAVSGVGAIGHPTDDPLI